MKWALGVIALWLFLFLFVAGGARSGAEAVMAFLIATVGTVIIIGEGLSDG